MSNDASAAGRSARLAYIHHARGLAILGVLLIHSNDVMNWPAGTVGDQIGAMLFNITACFVFISGYLFQHLSAKFEYRTYLTRKLRNVVLPYVIISIPAILVYLIAHKSHPWLPPDFFAHSPIYIAGYFLVTGQHLGPLWFMPTIFLYYLAAPVFFWIDRRPRFYWLILPLLVVSAFVVRPEHNENPLPAFVHLLPAYLLGMAASHWKDQLNPILARRFWLIAAIAAAFLIIAFLGFVAPGVSLYGKLPLSFAMIAVFLRYPHWRVLWLEYLAGISFGLYFAHAYVVGAGRMLEARMPNYFHYSPFELIPVFAVVLALSIAIVEIVRGTAGRWSRFIIGVPARPRRSPPIAPIATGVAPT